jgi:hypothetical protein
MEGGPEGRELEVRFVTGCLPLSDQDELRPVLDERMAGFAVAIAGSDRPRQAGE